LRDTLLAEITRWRAALRRTVLQAVEAGHLLADTDAEQLVAEIYALSMGCCTMPVSYATAARPNGPRHPGSACCEATRQRRASHNKETEKRGERAATPSPDVLVNSNFARLCVEMRKSC
jgi:hypothetical protein